MLKWNSRMEPEETELVSLGATQPGSSDPEDEDDLTAASNRVAVGSSNLILRKVGSTLKNLRTRQLSRSRSRGVGAGDSGALKRELNLFSAVAYVVGVLIGSGIFITPRTILCRTGSFGVSFIVWTIGGIVSMAGGLCFIELSLLIRKSGGEYNFVKEAYTFKTRFKGTELFGMLLSFLYVWSSVFVTRGGSIAVVCLASAQYLIQPFYIGCGQENVPQSAVKLLSLAIIIFLALINCYSLKLASRVMSIFSLAKVLAIVFIIAVGVIFMIKEPDFPQSFTSPFETLPGLQPSLSSFGLSLYSVLWAYDGWNAVSYATEETINVKRNLPLSLLIGIPLVTICYLLVNIVFFAILDHSQILNSATVALPFAKVTIGTAGLVFIPLLVSISTFSSANGTVFTSSRVIFAAAREGHLPEFLSGVHGTARTPIPAIIVQVVLAMFMVVVGTVDQLIDGLGFVTFIFYALCIVAVMILRVTRRKEPRLFKGWFIVPVAVAMTCFCVFVVTIPLLATPLPLLLALGFLLLGVPVYFFLVMDAPWKLRPKCLDTLSRYTTEVVNKILSTTSSRTQQLPKAYIT